MALIYKTPQQIASDYMLHLKSLKPEINPDQTDSDWWIRGQVVGGVVAGAYADQRKATDDAFPQLAREEAVEKHLNTYFDEGFTQPTQSEGPVIITGASGSTAPAGLQMTYPANGNIYQVIDTFLFGTATSGTVEVQSLASGQSQNLLAGAVLTISSPPAGINSTATVGAGNISDGRDRETKEQGAQRILTQVRTPLAGGKVADYKRFALDADDAVVDANVIRFPFGFGTLGVVIKAGTQDIDAALNAGQDIVQTPSQALIDTVQAYIDGEKIETDCVSVYGAMPVAIDCTVSVRYKTGDGSTIIAGQILTQEELVVREVKRAIYKTPPGGRKLGASGYVVASEIEEVIDQGVSASPYTEGTYAQILTDRQIDDLSASGANRLLLGTEIPVPGNISIVELV